MVFAGIALLIALGLIVGFWIGVIGLRGSSSETTWWLLASGVASFTLGPVLSGVGMYLYYQQATDRLGSSGTTAGTSDSMPGFVIAAMIIPTVGMLLFAAGFVLHGLEMARAQQRAQELEQLAATMSEELNRLR